MGFRRYSCKKILLSLVLTQDCFDENHIYHLSIGMVTSPAQMVLVPESVAKTIVEMFFEKDYFSLGNPTVFDTVRHYGKNLNGLS